MFCRTNFDCDNLERFLVALGGGGRWSGRTESGKENLYSCTVLGGARSTDQRREALEVCQGPPPPTHTYTASAFPSPK